MRERPEAGIARIAPDHRRPLHARPQLKTNRPRLHREGNYATLFPSASLKYNLTRALDLQVGFSQTVKRPQFGDVAGVWVINDDNLTVTAPNPTLRPERSRKREPAGEDGGGPVDPAVEQLPEHVDED